MVCGNVVVRWGGGEYDSNNELFPLSNRGTSGIGIGLSGEEKRG